MEKSVQQSVRECQLEALGFGNECRGGPRRNSILSGGSSAPAEQLRDGEDADGPAMTSYSEQVNRSLSDRFRHSQTMGESFTVRELLQNWRHGGLRVLGRMCLESAWFDICMCTLVLGNAVHIGVEQTLRLEGHDTSTLEWVESGFLIFYIIELWLQFYVHRLDALQNYWVRLDIFLVFTGCTTSWIFVPIFSRNSSFGVILLIRTIRLFRLMRTVRLIVRFRDLFMLVRGLLHSVGTMCHVLILFLIMIYIWGVVCIETITLALRSDTVLNDNIRDIIQENFRTLPITMLTLVQFLTFDNVVYIYKPMIEEDWRMSILFMVMLLVFGIVMMNLVTAIIVNSALEQAMQDKDMVKGVEEAKKQQMLKKLQRVFLRLDADRSGEVSREEVTSMGEEDRELLTNLVSVNDPGEIFDLLDIDGDGALNIGEFCKGIETIAFSNTPAELKRMERQIEFMYNQLKMSQTMQESLQFSISGLLTELHQRSEPCWPPSPTSCSSTAQEAPAAAEFGSEASKKQQERDLRRSILPPWTSELVLELRKTCKKEVRRAVEEANQSLADKVDSCVEVLGAQAEAQAKNAQKFGFGGRSRPGLTGQKAARSNNNTAEQQTQRRAQRSNNALEEDGGFASEHSAGSQDDSPKNSAPVESVKNTGQGVISSIFQHGASPLAALSGASKKASSSGTAKTSQQDSARQATFDTGSGALSPRPAAAKGGAGRGGEPWDSSGWSCDTTEPDPLAIPCPAGRSRPSHAGGRGGARGDSSEGTARAL